MDELTNQKALLDEIRLSEGNNFECDEKSIIKEYEVKAENKSNLAIKILSIFGAFIATLAFLGFLVIAGVYDSKTGLLIFGIIFISVAIWLNKAFNKIITDTFSISLYIIGFVLFIFGLSEYRLDPTTVVIFIICIAYFAMYITQNFILSFISTLLIGCSLFYLISLNNLDLIHLYILIYTIGLAYFMLNEAKIVKYSVKLSKLYNPIRIGLIISLLFGLISISSNHLMHISVQFNWVSSIVMFIVLQYIIFIVCKIIKIESLKSKIIIYTFSSLILILTTNSPSITGAIIIILLSFMVNYKTGFVIGIISFTYFITQYYYDLNLTLLTKSIILFSIGVLFISFYLFTSKKLSPNEKI